MDWSYRRNFLWVSSPGLHTLSREKFVSCSHKYQGGVEFRMLFKLLHTKQLNTALKTATSSRSRSIFSRNSWWEMRSSGNRTRSVRLVENTVPFNIRKFRKFKPGFLVKWNAPPLQNVVVSLSQGLRLQYFCLLSCAISLPGDRKGLGSSVQSRIVVVL